MKRRFSLTACASALTVAAMISAEPAAHGSSVLPPGSTVEGKTIGEWSADWWKWAVSFSVPVDPFTDETGAKANKKQHDPVFYLAGNTGGSSVRVIKVPAGRPILVPLLVAEIAERELDPDPEPPNPTPEEIRAEVNALVDLVDELHASIDGMPVPNLFSHREMSPDFSYVAAEKNIIGVPPGDSGVAAADGYWLMLEPLEVGEERVVNFGGGITDFDFGIDVTSTLHGVPEPGSVVLFGCGMMLVGTCYRRQRQTPESCATAE